MKTYGLLVALAIAGLTGGSVGAATKTECVGALPPGVYDVVVVPELASCVLRDSVADRVIVDSHAWLATLAVNIVDLLDADDASAILLVDSIAGGLRLDGAGTGSSLEVVNTTISGNSAVRDFERTLFDSSESIGLRIAFGAGIANGSSTLVDSVLGGNVTIDRAGGGTDTIQDTEIGGKLDIDAPETAALGRRFIIGPAVTVGRGITVDGGGAGDSVKIDGTSAGGKIEIVRIPGIDIFELDAPKLEVRSLFTDLNVELNIRHAGVGDLRIRLVAPGGSEVILSGNDVGGDLRLDGWAGRTEIARNEVHGTSLVRNGRGELEFADNRVLGDGVFAHNEGPLSIVGNVFGGDLVCRHNAPPAVASGNAVAGENTCEI